MTRTGHAPADADLPVVLSYGMGLDSTAVLARWLTEPASRDFPLERLTVLTAMTGDEPDVTRRLTEEHVLPLLRGTGTRLVQISRTSQRGGYTVLDDSRTPLRLIMKGPWRLSDELRASGTVPQLAAKRRLCSLHAKGHVLDGWLGDEFDGRPFRHVLGFATEELRRAERDEGFTATGRRPEYPLINDWGWDRQQCAQYLLDLFGEPWSRSACGYCPFSAGHRGRAELIERWRAEPAIGAQALALEFTAMALNPRSKLYGSVAAQDLARSHGLTDVLARFEEDLRRQRWSVYEVRRIVHPRRDDPAAKGAAWRSVRTVFTGNHDDAQHMLRATSAGSVVTDEYGITRAEIIPRTIGYPAIEKALALAPAGVLDKERPAFGAWWERLHHQTAPGTRRSVTLAA
ncbi:hypothetical protein [Streptomyces sp. Y1]|uniref:Phosphoadenosine phosphosulphate reductase domain-containing protein n=1 Tax=Streptomyces sp. Y1 TaxID=3238634 RepID=A0AB39TQ47_9ACTN